ncbi:hypothetical protein OQA88_3891 [Cercophora sp. LCS_1]
MAPRSLVEMSLRVVLDNATKITALTDMPPQFNHLILKNIKSAHQLHELEVNTEDLYLETEEHWRRIIQKDFSRLWEQHRWVADDPKNWYRVWNKYNKIHTESLAAATEALKQKFDQQKKEKDTKRAEFLHFNQTSRLPSSKPISARNPHWSQTRPKASTPLSKVRSRVKAEASRLKLTPKSIKAVTTKIEKAPESMLEKVRIERQGNPARAAALARPNMTARARDDQMKQAEKERKEMEARLLRIKGGPKAGESHHKETPLAFSDDDEDNAGEERGGHLADLFDEIESTSRPAASSPAPGARPSTNAGLSTTAPAARRRPLLSATPGANKATRVAASPPKSSSSGDSASPPALKPTPRPGAMPAISKLGPPAPSVTITALSATVTSASASVVSAPEHSPQPKRKREVNVFMRPKKKIRH